MINLFKKINIYILCLAQVFYSSALAGVGLWGQLQDEGESHSHLSVILRKDPVKSRYHMRLSTVPKSQNIDFVDEEHHFLGQLVNQGNRSQLLWKDSYLELDLSDINKDQETFFVKTKGTLNIISQTFSCPTVIEAEKLSIQQDLETVAPLALKASRARFRNIKSQNVLAIHVDEFTNPKDTNLQSRQLVLSSGKGKNHGSLLGEEVYLSGVWRNYNFIEAAYVRVCGTSYIGESLAVLKAALGFSLQVEDYTEYGRIEALCQSISAKRARYIRKEREETFPLVFGGYLWIDTEEFLSSSKSQFSLFKGMSIRVKASLMLKGQFCLERDSFPGFDPSILDESPFLSSINGRNNAPILHVHSENEVEVSSDFSAHLGDNAQLRVKGSKVIMRGDVEGGRDSSVNIQSGYTTIDSEKLPSILRLKSQAVFLERIPSKLDRLKVISKNVFLGSGVKSHILSLEAQESFLRSLTGSLITIDRAQIERSVFLGGVKINEFFESGNSNYFESLEGEGGCTIDSAGDLFIKHAEGSMEVRSDRDLTLLSASTENLIVDGAHVYLKDVYSSLSDIQGREVFVQDIHSLETHVQGEEVFLAGSIGEGSSRTIVKSKGHLSSRANFKGNVSLNAKGSLVQTGILSPTTHVQLEGKIVAGVGNGSPQKLSVETQYGYGLLREILDPQSPLQSKEFSLKVQEELDLARQTQHFPFEKTTLESASSVDISESHLKASKLLVKSPHLDASQSHVEARDLSLIADDLSTENSHMEVSDTYRRDVRRDLKASREYVSTLVNRVKVGGSADFSRSTESGTTQVFEVGEEMNVSEARFHSAAKDDHFTPKLIILSETLKGKASKVSKGSWSHLYEGLDRRPELICDGGPSVILTKKGFWLEAPILAADTLTWGSKAGDVHITPLTLTEVRRWTETHKKKNCIGQVSRSESTHEQKSEQLIKPLIGVQGDMVTTAKTGKAVLVSPEIFVGGNWEIYVKEFGVEAATILHHYSEQTTKKKPGLLGGSSSDERVSEEREEVVPPVLKINGNVYVYCENAHIDSAQAYIEGILHNHCPNLSFGAKTARAHREEHMLHKSFNGTAKQGYIFDQEHQVPGSLNVGEVKSEHPIHFTGSEDDVSVSGDGESNIQFEAPFTHQNFQQYASFDTNYLNMGVSAIVGLAATFATGGVGSGVTFTLTEAGFASAASMYATSFLNTGGDPIAAFQQVMSPEGLRSIGISMVTAGIMQKAGWKMPKKDPLTGGTPSFGERLIGELRRAGVRAAAEVTMGSKSTKKAVQDGFLAGIASTIGGYFSGEIGEHKEELGPVFHKITHGLVGAVTGVILSPDDRARGALSGAIGAASAEIFADMFNQDLIIQKALDQIEEERLAGNEISKELFERYVKDEAKRVEFWSKAGATLVTSLSKQDIYIGQETATTAVENNFYPSLIMLGMAAYELYDVAITYKEEGSEAALKKATVYAVEWALKHAAGKAISKALKAGQPVLEVLMKHCPAMGKIIDKVGIVYVKAEEKVFSTKIGAALHKADRAVEAASSRIKAKITGSSSNKVGNANSGSAAERAEEAEWFSKYWSKPKTYTFNGQSNKVHQRSDLIDPNKIHPKYNKPNIEVMKEGYAPVGPDNHPINLHHLTQCKDGGIAEVSQTFHQNHTKIIHINPKSTQTGIDRAQFDKWRQFYWQERAKDFQ